MLKRNWKWSEPRQEPSWPREQGHGYKEMCAVSLSVTVRRKHVRVVSVSTLLIMNNIDDDQESRAAMDIGRKYLLNFSQINAPSSTELRVRRNNAMWWSITRFNHCVQLNLWHQICSIIFCHHIYYNNIVIIFSVVISSVSRRGIVTS